MEKEGKDILLKIRSSRACIRDGYQLYTKEFRRIFRHTWLIGICFALLSALASALPVLISPYLLIPGIVLQCVAVILLFITGKWRLCRKQVLWTVGKVSWKDRLRHIDMWLLVGTVCLFVIAILSMLTSLPTFIMFAANWQSKMGMLNGDPVGMPSYVRWLSLAAFAIAGFLQAYVWLSALYPFHLVHTSIVLRHQSNQKPIQNNA